MNKMAPFVFCAVDMASLTSFTPELMALKVKNGTSRLCAMMLAMVVLPVPGAPHKIIEGILPFSIAVLKILPFPARCSCPTRSSSVCGRIRSASGAEEFMVQIKEESGKGGREACAMEVKN